MVSENTVLVIDDEPANIQVVNEFLASQGIDVVIASSGASGLERANKIKPDLILLDIRMSEMDGFDVCYRLKNQTDTKDIPVIFMTAVDELDYKLKGFAVGAVDYITKPIQESELLARVLVHLQIVNLHRELEDKNQKLEAALDTSNVVNVAVGVVMKEHNVNREEAFNVIRNIARPQRRKVAEIAEEILRDHNQSIGR